MIKLLIQLEGREVKGEEIREEEKEEKGEQGVPGRKRKVLEERVACKEGGVLGKATHK